MVNAADPTPPKVTPPPSDIKFIDVHVHAHSVKEDGLDAVAKWMDKRGVERCIVSPLDHKGSRDYTQKIAQRCSPTFASTRPIDRMCIITPMKVQSVEAAVEILQREIKDGAIAFGEHYGVGLMFDDPKNLRLYEACERVGLPVMFHIDQNKNMVEKGMERVDNVLKKYPKCNLIAHAYWWRQLKDADRQLQEHPNLYADMSGHVVPMYSAAIEHLPASSSSATKTSCSSAPTKAGGRSPKWPRLISTTRFFEELDLPKDVRYKLYRGNAEKLFGWEKEKGK